MGGEAVETNYSHVLQAEAPKTVEPWLLLKSVHKIYHDQFRRWFGIMAPTSLLAGIVLVVADLQLRAIWGSVPLGQLRFHLADIAAAGAVRLGSYFMDWLLGCFALAAIATVVNDMDQGDVAEGWRRDSYQQAREHLGALVALAFITLVAYFSGMIAFDFLKFTALRRTHWFHLLKYTYPIVVIESVVVASLVSWLGVAIPLILKGNTRVRTALKKSVELSNGYEGALFLLVVESVAGSMIVWYTVVHGLPLFLPRHLIYTAWYGWLLNAVGVLAASTIDAPLFIGLSVLADPERLNASSLAASGLTA